MQDQLKSFDQISATAIDLGMRFGPKLVVAILLLVAGYAVGGWAARAVDGALGRFQLEPPVRMLVARAVRILVLVLFAIMALQNLGVDLLPLIAGLSVAGAGVALAMQGVLGNLVAGLNIIFTKPYRVGEYISIVGKEGEVLEIGLFNTILGHADRSRVVIPNRKIVGEILHNYAGTRQLALEVAIADQADVDKALGAIRDVLAANRRVLREPAAVFGVARIGDAAAAISVGPWTSLGDYGPAGDEIYRAVMQAFRERGIAAPLPRREIRLVAASGALADAGVRAA